MCICKMYVNASVHMCMGLTRNREPPSARFPKLARIHLSAPARPAEPMSSAGIDNP